MNNKKLNVLKMIAHIFNENNIKWNVSASCMLYLRGVVDTFNDIDFMVSLKDISKVKELLKSYPKEIKEPNEQYQTKVFLEYDIDGVEIDVMAGFTIVKDDTVYAFDVEDNQVFDYVTIEEEKVYLDSLEAWLRYYQLMNRNDKVKIISDYLRK